MCIGFSLVLLFLVGFVVMFSRISVFVLVFCNCSCVGLIGLLVCRYIVLFVFCICRCLLMFVGMFMWMLWLMNMMCLWLIFSGIVNGICF